MYGEEGSIGFGKGVGGGLEVYDIGFLAVEVELVFFFQVYSVQFNLFTNKTAIYNCAYKRHTHKSIDTRLEKGFKPLR